MPDPVALLLAAPDETSLRASISYAGGYERAIRVLFDAAYRLQVHGGTHEEILRHVDVCDRIDALVRRRR